MATSPTTFQPGQSANPGGRRGNPELFKAFQAKCREMEPAALAALAVKIGEGDMKAIELVLAYGRGRPPQAITGEGGEGEAIIRIITGVPRAGD